MNNLCAWCDAPKQSGLICPDCGADYAKAEAIKSKGKAEPAPALLQENAEVIIAEENQIPVRDPIFEQKVCLFALPSMLAFAMLVQVTGFLASMQRIFFGMPIHEMGHAVSGWLCGYNSIPTLWKTLIPENRGYLSTVILLVGLIALCRYALKHKRPAWFVAIALILFTQFYGTFVINQGTAEMYITMGGDAMGLILATLLIGTFYVGKETQIYKGSLRWGFLGIGSAAFMDMYTPWWNKDISAIGYGLTGGIPTDSWKMINIHFWSWDNLFNTHITLGIACLLSIAAVYILGLKQANYWVKEHAKKERLRRLNAT